MHSKFIRSISAIIAASSLTFTSGVSAEEGSFTKEVEYRQAVMTVIAYNTKKIGSMLKGDTPYDVEKIKTHAKDIASLSSLEILSAFPEDSVTDESDAMEDIWMDFETFEQKLQDFRTAAAGINKAAQSGDKAAVGAAMKDLGASCKGCHKKFKN